MFEVGTLYRGQLESFNTLELAYECANSYGLNEMWDKDDQVIVTEDNVPIDAFRPTSEFREISHTNSLTVDTHQATLDTSAHNPLATKDLQMNATVATVTPEIAAAMDVRVLDIIENVLMDHRFNNKLIDDLVLSIQEYLKSPNSSTQAALALIAEQAKLRGIWKITQQIKNSKDFLNLVAENTPDEAVPAVSVHEANKPEVVAVATTAAEVVSSKADASSLRSEPKKDSKTPKAPKPAKNPKATPKLPMPTIASIEALDRKGLIEAVKAVKSNNPDITLRANAATVELQKALASSLLGVDYVAPAKAPKAPKTTKAKTQEIISLPEGLSWEECKGMKYRQLQQVCKALRSQGLFQGNVGGKGATGEALLKGCADYFRSQGVDIAEVTVSPSKTPIKELHLPNLARARKDAELAKLATEALKLNNEDAKVMLELAVAA